MNIAVTGASGFIGDALVRVLVQNGASVRILSRLRPKICDDLPSLQFKQCDLEVIDSQNLAQYLGGIDVLYHCAAENNDPTKMEAVNVAGTLKLARAASGRIIHWVQVSSVGVYGTQHDGVITENTPVHPMNIYEATKAKSDEIVIQAAKDGGFTCAILRPSKVYGKQMRNHVLHTLINLLDKNLFFYIGDPGGAANYVHISNVADALIKCGTIRPDFPVIYNLSDYLTIEDFVEIISKALGKDSPSKRISELWARRLARLISWAPFNPLTQQRIDAMVKKARYSSEKIEQELGYVHKISMDRGLTELVNFYKPNKCI